jgi:hypothetical protein
MATDDRRRGLEGVVASIVEIEGGKLRLVFDDVQIDSSEWPYDWKTRSLYTWLTMEAIELSEFTFSEKQLADIGASLIARLRAK